MTDSPVVRQTPNPPARIAGICYLLNFVVSFIGVGLSRSIVVRGNVAATLTNIAAHASIYWLGYAGFILTAATYIAVTALFYQLFRPVNKTVSLGAAFFSIVGCTAVAMSAALYAAPSLLIGTTTLFSAAQTQAVVGVLLRLFNEFFNVSFPFFGFYCLSIGYLVYKSTFLPRILGVLMMIAGLGWLTFLWPPFVRAFPWIVAGGVGEIILTAWLLVRGVNTERWKQIALDNS
jgi:hypothetical protein